MMISSSLCFGVSELLLFNEIGWHDNGESKNSSKSYHG
jgi:hypothetical protein